MVSMILSSVQVNYTIRLLQRTFAIDIAANMGTTLQHEHALSRAVCLVGKDSTKEAAADDEKIVHEYPS